MPTYSYPTSQDLMTVEQEMLPRLMADRLIFKYCTLENHNAARVSWEQEDNFAGLQGLRGYNGEPGKVNAPGQARYSMAPGVYGEYLPIDEEELTERRAFGEFGKAADISDLVMKRSALLQQRFLDRVESSLWSMFQGSYKVSARGGKLVQTDTFAIQTYTASVPWSTTATASPLSNLGDVKLFGRGQSVSFGADAVALCNLRTANNLLANTNANDLYSKRPNGLSTIFSIDQANQVLAGEGRPQLVVYDGGYLAEQPLGTPATRAAFTPFIPDNTVIVIGKRPGNARVASYLMTRNANNPDASPGQYSKVIDRGEIEVPRSIEVHNGHNGGPALFYPGAIVLMNV